MRRVGRPTAGDNGPPKALCAALALVRPHALLTGEFSLSRWPGVH